MKDEKKIIDERCETTYNDSKPLKLNENKTKGHINKINESDLKIMGEFDELIQMLKKPIWKIAFGIIVVSSIFNIMYLLGLLIGKFIAILGGIT